MAANDKTYLGDNNELYVDDGRIIHTSTSEELGSSTETVEEQSAVGTVFRTKLTVSEAISITNGNNAGYGSKKIYDLPAGAILIAGVVADLTLTASSTDGSGGIAAAFDGDVALGTSAATDLAVANILAAQQDIAEATATTQAVDGVCSSADILSVNTITALTDSSGGTAASSLVDVTSAVSPTQDALTDNGAGTADATVEDVADIALDTSNTYTDAAVNGAVNTAIASISNNFKEMTTELAKIKVDIAAVIADMAKEATTENNFASLAAKQAEIIRALTGMKALVADGTATAKDVYLNLLVDTGDISGDDTLTAAGTIYLTWINLGDK